MNAALKRLQRWMEVSADMMVFTLYKLQLASHTDIVRSTKGLGPLKFVASLEKGKERFVKAMSTFCRLSDNYWGYFKYMFLI